MPLYGPPCLPLPGGTMTGTITSTLGTITTNQPCFTGSQTWNNGATTFQAFLINVVATAKAGASNIFEFQVSGTKVFYCDAGGNAIATGSFTTPGNINTSGSGSIQCGGAGGTVALNNTGSTGVVIASVNVCGWSSTNSNTGTRDVAFGRSGIGIIEANTGSLGALATFQAKTVQSAPSTTNGQSLGITCLTELTTIAAAATTDTAIQIPAGAIVLAVNVRVTTAITCTSTFTVGDAGNATRYSTAAVSKAATSTDAGTKAGPFYNASAASIRITPDTTPSDATGRLRVTIFYWLSTPPTS